MKIAVCFKTIADYGRLSDNDWVWDARHFVDTSFVRRVFNCFDESALEMALKLSGTSQNGSDTAELSALTVDDRRGDLFLKHLTAVGYHHVVRIQCNKKIDLRFNSSAVSHLISAYIQREGHQLVLLGTQGGDGDNGQTGFLVAERLGWPCIREVTAVVMAGSSDRLKVTSRIDGATLVQTVQLPMVLIAGHCLDSPYLRIPTLKQKLKANKNQVTILSNTELGIDNDTLINNGKTLINLQRPPVNRPCVFLEGNSSREQAKRLYDEYLRQMFAL
jgi:electron transfer flavoprotein alpha/beta subunit